MPVQQHLTNSAQVVNTIVMYRRQGRRERGRKRQGTRREVGRTEHARIQASSLMAIEKGLYRFNGYRKRCVYPLMIIFMENIILYCYNYLFL